MVQGTKRLVVLLLLILLGSAGRSALSDEARQLTLRWELPEQGAAKLQELFQTFGIEKRLLYFVDANLVLPKDLELVMHQGGEPFVDVMAGRAYLPEGMFLEMLSSIAQRYPEQEHSRKSVYAAAVEHVLWQQFAKLLVSQLSVSVQGEEAFVLDNFVSVMLLNLYESPYLLDAAEEFLVVDSGTQVLADKPFDSELEFDRARYQRIACLVLGRDYQPYAEILETLSWDEKHLQLCQERYRKSLNNWYEALEPSLKQNAPLARWRSYP